MRIVQRSSGEGRGSEATDRAKRGPSEATDRAKRGPSEARPEQIIAEAEERGADATSPSVGEYRGARTPTQSRLRRRRSKL